MFKTYRIYINVPYRLVKRYRSTKQERDLLCFAICLKLYKGQSGMYLTNEYAVMKLLHCSQGKAKRLIRDAVHDAYLFDFNPKTKFLRAKSFRRGAAYINSQYGKETMRLFKDSCIRIGCDDVEQISHYQISWQLQDKVMLRQTCVRSSSGNSNCLPICPEMKKPLTQKFIGNMAGCHQTTVSRHLRKLAKKGVERISITSHPKIPVYDLEHGIVINDIPNRRPFISGRFAYIRDVNEYDVHDDEILSSYNHIIWNHPKRTCTKTSKPSKQEALWPWDLFYAG